MGNKKLIGALAVTGGVLALGSTAAAFAGGDGQSGSHPADVRPVSSQQQSQQQSDRTADVDDGDRFHDEQDRDEIRTGPKPDRAHPHRGNPWPEHCSTEQPPISSADAERIALEKVPGASVTEIDLDRCYGLEWELDLHEGDIEYEIEINANDGQIVSFEEDEDD